MLKVLAGDLSATFNLDGMHGQRYVARRAEVAQSLCEQLLLHDQVIIPTQDYLTASGLIALFGEKTVIALLESDQLRFIRLRGLFGYIRGKGSDGGLATFRDPASQKPQDSSIEASISAGLDAFQLPLGERTKLEKLLAEKSHPMELAQVLGQVKDNAYADLRHTSLWRDYYTFQKPGLLKLPGMQKMQVRVLGPTTNALDNPVDALLALALTNIELYLSNQFGCASMSTGSPIGDCIELKLNHLKHDHPARSRLWSFFDVANVPNLAAVTLADPIRFADLLRLTQSRNARVFREWFHQTATLSEKEVYARYVDLLHDVPWAQTAPVKALRFAISTGIDMADPVLGKVAGAVDSLLHDRLLRGNSAKYFVEDLRSFSGKIGVRGNRRK
jgi:hypothetical protein